MTRVKIKLMVGIFLLNFYTCFLFRSCIIYTCILTYDFSFLVTDCYTERNEEDYDVREDNQNYDTILGNTNNNAKRDNIIEDVIEKDPDLSVANSTQQKSQADTKDQDLSLDEDENIGISLLPPTKKGKVLTDVNVMKNKVLHQDIQKHKVKETDELSYESTYTPPPVKYIYIPVSHDYGYGFYVNPLWVIDSKKNASNEKERPRTASTERLQKVRQMISDGRKRRSRRLLKVSIAHSKTE